MLKEQITHIEDKNMANFHENIMKLSRKGMNALHSNTKIPLVKRWHYSQHLANWLNEQTAESIENLSHLKNEMESYFSLLRKLRMNENYVFELSQHHTLNRTKELILLVLLAPFSILGILHCGLPYILIKRFVEKSFKRRVFWGSVKLILGMIIMGLLNIPVLFLFYNFIYPSYLLAFLYYALIGLFGLAAYKWWKNFLQYREKGVVMKTDVTKIVAKRKVLMALIETSIPVQ
jgi:hypothetical protein